MYGFESYAEVPYATLNTAFGSVAESLTLTDAQSVTVGFFGTVSDTIYLTTDQQGVVNYSPTSVVEGIGLGVTDDVTAAFLGDRAESMSLSAAQNVTVVFVGDIQESVTLSQTQDVIAAFVAAQDETLSLSANQNVIVAFVGSVAETLSLAETESVQAAFIASCLEQMSLTQTQCAFGWFGINDDQSPQWGLVTVNVEDVAAYGAFVFGGVPFAGSRRVSGVFPNPLPSEQDPNWTELDDDQATTWNEIDNSQNC